MKVEDFIQEFRSTVMDNEVPYFWTSENIVRYLNEAVQEACERAKLIEDRSTPSVCSLLIEPGVSTYNLHPSVLEIKRLTLNGQKLEETSVDELDEDSPGWELLSGKPSHFIFEQASGAQPPRLRFVRSPVSAGSVALTVFRGALKPLSADVDAAKPEVHERFHERLMDWVMHRAYLQQDAEVFDPSKAATSLALFVQAFGERPDANVQRKHRDRTPPLVHSNW